MALWQVIGGGSTGGLLVRAGPHLDSEAEPTRLPHGAVVVELQKTSTRLHFRRLNGSLEGWVSLSLKGRPLLRPVILASRQHLEDLCQENGIQPLRSTDLELYCLLTELGVDHVEVPMAPHAEVALQPAVMESAPVGRATGPTGAPGAAGAGAWTGDVEVFDAYQTDPYQIFGIPYDATDAAIKSAYRKLSLKVHPDRCPGDAAAMRFQQLTLAKEFLLDPYQRRAFNEVHGFLTPTVNVAWWSDWDEIFSEIEAESETPALPRPPVGAKIDVLILGATGITGTLACMVMQRSGRRSWGMAGRDGRKLQLLQHKFACSSLCGTFRIGGREDLVKAVGSARVVMDFTGPSHDVGPSVAEACIECGTHLIDNTGDIMFSKRVKDSLDEKAKAAGVCLLLHAGYVALPTDFGVWRLVSELAEHFGPTRKVDVYTYTQGFVMSGTSLLTGTKSTIKELNAHGAPFVLGGVRPGGIRTEDRTEVPHKDENSSMIAFPGLNVDRQVVRGSCGLMDETQPYGPNFLFKDWFLVVDKRPEEMTKQESAQASRLSGIGVSLSGGGGHSMMVELKKIPPPGWGPKERIRQETFVTKVFVGVADTPAEQKMHIVMNSGPGGVGDRYEGTATMMLEAASCLLDAADAGRSLRSGWGTPVFHLSHLGFFQRLQSLGVSFQLFHGAPSSDFMHRVFSATLPLQNGDK